MLRTFREVASVLFRTAYEARQRRRTLRARQGSFLYSIFFAAIPLFGIGVRNIHRLTFPYSKVAPRSFRA